MEPEASSKASSWELDLGGGSRERGVPGRKNREPGSAWPEKLGAWELGAPDRRSREPGGAWQEEPGAWELGGPGR